MFEVEKARAWGGAKMWFVMGGLAFTPGSP